LGLEFSKENITMKRLWTSLLVIPALLLLVTSEANAQRRGGFGISVGTGGYGSPGFGYSSGSGYGNGFGYGYPGGYGGFNRGYGYGGFNQGYGYGGYGGYGYPGGYGYGGSGLSISLGNYGNRYGYGNYGNNYYNNGYNLGYSSGYSGYSNPTYSTGGVTYYTSPSDSSNGIAQSSYTTPTYSTEGGVIQAGAWSPQLNDGMMASTTPAVAKVKLTVPDKAEVWVDGKQSEGSGTTREFTTDAISSWTQVKLKIKQGDSTREFTMPVRPGEDSKVDITPLLR